MLVPLDGLEAERATTASLDVGRTVGEFELNGTLFGSRAEHALQLVERESAAGGVELRNAAGPSRTLEDIADQLEHASLSDDAAESFRTLRPIERTVQGNDGRTYGYAAGFLAATPSSE